MIADHAFRDDRESELAAAVALILADFSRDFSGYGDTADWESLRRRIAAEVAVILAATYATAADAALTGLDHGIRPDYLSTTSERWAQDYAERLATEIVDRTRQEYDAAQAALDAGEIDDATATAIGVALFGPDRAALIAATETTAAISAGEFAAVGRYQMDTGRIVTPYWATELDDRVCPVCRPLDGLGPDSWSNRFPGGPPAHPRCRCELDWRVS